MNKFIQKLQQKPENQRRRILLLSTAVLTVLIFLFWLASFRNVLNETNQGKKTVETSPFSVLKDNLSSVYQGFNNTTATTSTSTPEAPLGQ